ncbi:carbohydrate ABC transporter permease, partial [Geobacillus sp. ZGt-1]
MKEKKTLDSKLRSPLRRIAMGILYFILVVVALLQLYPLVWLFLLSLKTNQEVFGMSPFALPKSPRWENYINAWFDGGINQYFFNSVWYTIVAVVLTLILASFVTFALTRMEWKFKGVVLALFMIAYMIPLHSTLIPLFNIYNKMNLIDNPISIILSYTTFNLPIT